MTFSVVVLSARNLLQARVALQQGMGKGSIEHFFWVSLMGTIFLVYRDPSSPRHGLPPPFPGLWELVPRQFPSPPNPLPIGERYFLLFCTFLGP